MQEEAHYVAALLNSDYLNMLIKPFQSTGLLGERHVHKKVLEAPIPLFDKEQKLHRDLAELGADCNRIAQDAVNHGQLTHARSLARSRKQLRELLKPQLEEIDARVKRLLR